MIMDEMENGAGMDGVILSPALLTSLFADVLVPIGSGPATIAAGRPRRPGNHGHPENSAGIAPGDKEPEQKKPEKMAEINAGSPALPAASLRSTGENRRRICLVVAVPGREILTARTKNFLEKMLAACQLTIADLAIINISLSPASAADLQSAFMPEKWLLSGVSPSSLQMDAAGDLFEVVRWEGTDLLTFPALAEMEADTAAATQLKRRLWTGLQKMFGL